MPTCVHATGSLFRLETLPAYDVPTDRGDFPRYLAGEPDPDMERKGRWLDFLREQPRASTGTEFGCSAPR